MDLLQEVFIHPPEPCEARFIMNARALFKVFWTVEQKHPPTAVIELRSARTIFYIIRAQASKAEGPIDPLRIFFFKLPGIFGGLNMLRNS